MSRYPLYIFFFLSGVAGLGYEILWTRMLSISLGHEIAAMLAVVSAFFSGLALGAWCLDRPVSRSLVPGRWYVFLEVIIGGWALVLIVILPITDACISEVIGIAPSSLKHWTLAFFYPFAVLLPATFAMGGTLPAMDRVFERLARDGFAVAGLYGINTLGAMAGTFLVTFMILPRFGMNKTSILLSLINFFIAAIVFVLAGAKKSTGQAVNAYWLQSPSRPKRLYFILFMTGLLGIGFEVLMTRVLSQAVENTVYSFAALLMIFLFGTALGAWIYQWKRPACSSSGTLCFLLLSTAFFCLVSIAMLQFLYPVFEALQRLFGTNYHGAIAAELSLALLFFLLPTISMGATFSHLAQSLKSRDQGVGRALCLNTLGGAVAPVLFGVWLLPLIGINSSLLLVAMAYILCLEELRRPVAAAALALAVLALYLGVHSNPRQFITLDHGDSVVSHKEGIMATVSVIQDDRQQLHLKVNNRFQMGGTTSVFSDRRQAYLPLLLNPKPERALFLGLGTGSTFAATALFPDIKAEGVELVPEVIEALPFFRKVTGDFDTFTNLHIINADARRYVVATKQKYDVIVADLFHPARDGAGNLYTLEHFQAIRKVLQQDGLFCQWLPLYQLDLATFKVIVKTFLEVFPEGQAYLAHYSLEQPIIGLVGSREKLRYSEKWFGERLPDQKLRKHLSEYGYDSPYSFLGTFIAAADTLSHYAGSSPLNTDAFPVVIFQGPRFVYQSQSPASERLLTLLGDLSPPAPQDIMPQAVTEEDHTSSSRLTAYWAARNSFLEVGTRVERTGDVVKLYKTASEPLLAVVKKSVDFTAAYFPLVSIAYKLYPYDADASYRLLHDLERANPVRPEAGLLRQRLFAHESLPLAR